MNPLDTSAVAYLSQKNAAEHPSLDELSACDARQRFLDNYQADQNPQEDVDNVFERDLNGIRLKCWRGIGAPTTNAPALLYIHGGGWLLGSPESHEGICRKIANGAGAVVMAPDYRLAPEHPFPTGLNDCANALQYLNKSAMELGIYPENIAVGGDSSGGNLAAVLALMSRDGDLPKLAAQLLIYPNTEQNQSSESFTTFANGFGLSATEMAWFRDHYLPTADFQTDWHTAPLLTDSLSDVAPALIVLAGHDILFDEGKHYAERLKNESRVSVKTWAGQIHGFLSLDRHMPEAAQAITWLCRQWGRL